MMDEKFQQAILATRVGKKREAQFLLTQVLKEDPTAVQAWFLLGHLVDSEQKQLTYLDKALTLDPGHEKAKQKLTDLQMKTAASPTSEPVTAAEAIVHKAAAPAIDSLPVSTSTTDFVTQEKGDTLPSWLADDAEHLNLAQATAVQEQTEAMDAPATRPDVPDWLQEPTDEVWSESTQVTEPVPLDIPPAPTITPDRRAPKPRPIAAAKRPQPGTRNQELFLTQILYGLIALAVIVSVLLLYLLIF